MNERAERSVREPRILVVGPPRSGTTWIAQAIRHGAGCRYVHEPDNERYSPLALRLKAGLGRFPVLGPDDDAAPSELLWRRAFRAGGPRPWVTDRFARGLLKVTPAEMRERALRADGHVAFHLRAAGRLASTDARVAHEAVVIKSVHSALALDWLTPRFRPSTVIVLRNPLNVLASYRDLEMRDQDRDLGSDVRVRERVLEPRGIVPLPPTADPLRRAAWQLGLFMTVLSDAAAHHAVARRLARRDTVSIPQRGSSGWAGRRDSAGAGPATSSCVTRIVQAGGSPCTGRPRNSRTGGAAP